MTAVTKVPAVWACEMASSCCWVALRSAEPTPNQPGARARIWIHAKTQGIARSVSKVGPDAVERATGRLAMGMAPMWWIGVTAVYQGQNSGASMSWRYAVRAAAPRSFMISVSWSGLDC